MVESLIQVSKEDDFIHEINSNKALSLKKSFSSERIGETNADEINHGLDDQQSDDTVSNGSYNCGEIGNFSFEDKQLQRERGAKSYRSFQNQRDKNRKSVRNLFQNDDLKKSFNHQFL